MYCSEKEKKLVGFPEVLLKHLWTKVAAFSLSNIRMLECFLLYLKLHLEGSAYNP